jgi:hypothetical protein
MRNLPVIIIVFSLAVFPSCKNGGLFGKKAKARAEMEYKAKQDSIRIADSLRKAQEFIQARENARLDSIRKAEEELLNAGSRYNIIVGSFITPEYAASMADEYTRMGYQAKVLKPAGSKFQFVAAEGHEDIRTAAKRLAAFQDTVQMESWIYKRE